MGGSILIGEIEATTCMRRAVRKAGLILGHDSSDPTTAAETTAAFRSQGVHQAGECSSSGEHHNLWVECLVGGKKGLNHPSTNCQTS